MARKDWYYAPIPSEMAEAIDKIVNNDGRKHGILDKTTLIRQILGDFIIRYETKKRL